MQRLLHLFFQADMDKDIHIQPQHLRRQQGHLLADHPQLFHGPHPVETRRGRQVHRACQLGIGDAGVLLQAVENADISTIEFAHKTKSPVFCVYAECLSAPLSKGNQLERKILLPGH
ncbi:hypothetical protein D9M73_230400 [compost metagenome]